jgi:hypothetical protein
VKKILNMKIILRFIIIWLFLNSSCKKADIKIPNQTYYISKYASKYTSNGNDYRKSIEIKYNSDFLPINYNESFFIPNGIINTISNFVYNKGKLIEINKTQGNVSTKIILNWKSNNLIEFVSTYIFGNTDTVTEKGNIELKDGLVKSYKSEKSSLNNLNFIYGSNSNLAKVTDEKNDLICEFSKFDNKSNPFSTNFTNWMIISLLNAATLSYENIGMNNSTEILYSKYSPKKLFDMKYNENNFLSSCQIETKSYTDTTKTIITNVEYEYIK